MASVLLSPVGNGQQFFDNNGLPLAGGLIYTYQAGSSTPLTTYTTVNGTTPNSNPIILDAAGRTSQEVWMQTGYSYKFVLQTSTGIILQTLDNLYPILQNTTGSGGTTIPAGLIAIWSGSTGSIPSGWLICDGSNGTPDLRNSFVIGAGSSYGVGSTGGSKDAIVVSHTHTATSTDAGHTHVEQYNGGSAGGGNGISDSSVTVGATASSVSTATGYASVSTTISSAGTSGTNANLPPYYALAFIMKT